MELNRFSSSVLLSCFLLACGDSGDEPGGGSVDGAGAADGAGASDGAGATNGAGASDGAGAADGAGASDGSGATDGGTEVQTFRVVGRELQDRCGEKVVLRGVNEMIVWSGGKDGEPEYAEIAKTGANSVRIVWNEEGTADELDVAIAGALAHDMIPMIEHHTPTGDLTLVPEAVDYWLREDVLAVIQKYEADLLLNIANEAGDGNVTAQDFSATYETAITRLRAAGLLLPLVIDAPEWGQNIDVLQAAGPGLVEHDPAKNLLFSVHMWWDDESGARVKSELAESVEMALPLIVGEFAQHSVWQCADNLFAYKVLMDEAQRLEVGWLAWSWGGVENNDCKMPGEGSFDMTVGGVFGNWNETWGEEVAVTDPNSIQNTSIRPASITMGECR